MKNNIRNVYIHLTRGLLVGLGSLSVNDSHGEENVSLGKEILKSDRRTIEKVTFSDESQS